MITSNKSILDEAARSVRRTFIVSTLGSVAMLVVVGVAGAYGTPETINTQAITAKVTTWREKFAPVIERVKSTFEHGPKLASDETQSAPAAMPTASDAVARPLPVMAAPVAEPVAAAPVRPVIEATTPAAPAAVPAVPNRPAVETASPARAVAEPAAPKQTAVARPAPGANWADHAAPTASAWLSISTPLPRPRPTKPVYEAGGMPETTPEAAAREAAMAAMASLEPVKAAEPPAPAIEAPVPVVEAAAPVVEAPWPAVETPKPAVEAPQPVVEAPKPVAEAPSAPKAAVIALANVPLPHPKPQLTPAQQLSLTGKELDTAHRCLSQAIYFEARNQSVRGQIAVAQVVINRSLSPYYPNDICGVVYQGSHRHLSCQFTFACDGKSEAIRERGAWARAQRIAKQTLEAKLWLPEVAKSTHYHDHAGYVRPYWIREMKTMGRFGAHIFYRPHRWGDGANEPNWGMAFAKKAGKL